MSRLPNYHSWLGDVRAIVVLLCASCTAAVAADLNDVNIVEDAADTSAPANAALELVPVAPAAMPKVDEEPPDQPAVEDSPLVTRENIAIRRGGQLPEAGTGPLPWYRSGLASLGLVLCVITVAALVIKRVAKTSRGGGSGVLQVLTRTHLSPKQSIAVVQMGRRLVFVGITPEQISTLRVVEDREEAALLRGQLRVGAGQPEGAAFDKHLSREAKELVDGLDIDMEANGGTPNPQSGAREDLRGLLDRLRAFQDRKSRQPTARRKLMADG